jgi:hypothetical protein
LKTEISLDNTFPILKKKHFVSRRSLIHSTLGVSSSFLHKQWFLANPNKLLKTLKQNQITFVLLENKLKTRHGIK